jgi:transcription antitermination protein NusB
VSPIEPRDEALQALYTADLMDTAPDVRELHARAAQLVSGVWGQRADIDRVIGEIAVGWRVERMPAVDRNILRIGAYELLNTDTPVGVIVSEAVELAKRYSTAKSGAFVNGVLGRLAEELKALRNRGSTSASGNTTAAPDTGTDGGGSASG